MDMGSQTQDDSEMRGVSIARKPSYYSKHGIQRKKIDLVKDPYRNKALEELYRIAKEHKIHRQENPQAYNPLNYSLKKTYGHKVKDYGYSTKPKSYEPVYDYAEPSYGYQEKSYGYEKPAYGHHDPYYGHKETSYGYDKHSYGYEEPKYGYEKKSYGYEKPSYGYEKKSYGYQEPSYGYDKHARGLSNRQSDRTDAYGRPTSEYDELNFDYAIPQHEYKSYNGYDDHHYDYGYDTVAEIDFPTDISQDYTGYEGATNHYRDNQYYTKSVYDELKVEKPEKKYDDYGYKTESYKRGDAPSV